METILKREVVSGIEGTYGRHELAEKAFYKLGYAPLAREIRDDTMLVKLIAAGFTPYSNASVNKYMAMQKRKANWQIWKASIAAKVAVVAFLSAVFLGYKLCMPGDCFSYMEITVMLFILAAGLTAPTIIEDGVTWNLISIKDYVQPIPVSIIEKALAINNKFGGDLVTFVAELGKKEKVYDPFLVVRRRDSSNDRDGVGRNYYIAVWNEPTFEDSQPQ